MSSSWLASPSSTSWVGRLESLSEQRRFTPPPADAIENPSSVLKQYPWSVQQELLRSRLSQLQKRANAQGVPEAALAHALAGAEAKLAVIALILAQPGRAALLSDRFEPRAPATPRGTSQADVRRLAQLRYVCKPGPVLRSLWRPAG